MKSKELRRKEALERQEDYKSLTTTQKVLKLDLKLGGGLGAIRQREKLAQISIKESEGRVAKVNTEVEVKKPKPKPAFASKAEERKWEFHQKQKAENKK